MKITFLPENTAYETDGNETLLHVARKAGLEIASDCAGNGTCGTCRVRMVSGDANGVSPEEEAVLSPSDLADGWRLACLTVPISDCIVEIPSLNSDTAKGNISLPADFVSDGNADAHYGLAFDIGTTTIAGMLCDLQKGEILAAASRANPQGKFGADVISRIEHCMKEKRGFDALQSAAAACMNDIAGELEKTCGVKRRDIARAVAVGNTTMTHILLGIDPQSLARSPFRPVFLSHEPVNARSVGLKLGFAAKLEVLPNIAGHVGADIAGAILSSRVAESEEPAMLIDIGTNGEMAFVKDHRLLVCSTAAGPAFEGACISCGMRAAPGAIIRAEVIDGRFVVTAEGGARPIGICGSGLIDIVALLLGNGVIDASGKLLAPEAARENGAPETLVSRIRQEGRVQSFLLYEDDERKVSLSQKDIREVQLAKAAIAAGMKLLMKELGITPNDLSRVMLAGAFGSHIRAGSALRLGLLPNVPEERVVSLGNAAGAGACMALLSHAEAVRAAELARKAEHVELASHPDFQGAFIAAMRF